MGMFSAYFDESGTHAGSPVLAVAGYMGFADKWARFEEKWERVLKAYSVEVPFHMTDFENRQQGFKHLEGRTRNQFFTQLVRIISEAALFGFGAAVSLADYEKLVKGPVKNSLGTPYTLCTQQCLLLVSRWMDEFLYEGQVAYFFEAGVLRASETAEVWQKIIKDDKERRRCKALSIRFASKRDLRPLQAADILAYETWKHLKNTLAGSPRQRRESLNVLLSHNIYRGRFIGRKELQQIVR